MNFTISLIVTNLCQLRCKYCYETTQEEKIYFDPDETVNFILQSEYFDRYDNITIEFIGGEPLLNLNGIRKVVESLSKDDKYNFVITTNGCLLNDDLKDFISTFKFVKFIVSLDGNQFVTDMNRVTASGEGTYDKVIRFINYLKDNKVCYSLKGTFNSRTLPYLYDSMIEFLNIGVSNLRITPIFEEEWTPADGDTYLELLKKITDYIFLNNLESKINPLGRKLQEDIRMFSCNIGFGRLCIDALGDIYPCIRFAMENKNMKIGSINSGIDVSEFLELASNINISRDRYFPVCYSSCIINGINRNFMYMYDAETKARRYWDGKI